MIKRYMGLFFSLTLVALLFYCCLQMAEKGTMSLMGGEEENPRAVRISLLDDGKLELTWAGNNRVIDMGGAGKQLIAFKDNTVSLLRNIFAGEAEEAEKEGEAGE
ncbi:MAG TPA: hypothetical protein GX697_02195 [Firmicutes bacterium]|nr:hypothetical protein [Bacillota bacterium]